MVAAKSKSRAAKSAAPKSASKAKAETRVKSAAKPASSPPAAKPKAESKKPETRVEAKRGKSEASKPKAETQKEEPKRAEALPAPGERKSKVPPKFTVRAPAGADELKAKIGALATAIAQIRNLKRTLSKSFMEVGGILIDIRDRKLFEAKGYGSFEAFVEREIELGKQTSLKLARAFELFQKPAAVAGGLDRVMAAVGAFDGEVDPQANPPTSPTSAGGLRSPIPFHKR